MENEIEKPMYSIKVKTTLDSYDWAVKANSSMEKPSGLFAADVFQ